MKTKTRTFPTSCRHLLSGHCRAYHCLLLGIPLLVTGIITRLAALIVPAALLLACCLALWVVRARTVVTLNSEGISYSSPFRKLHFPWRQVRSAGVYRLKKGKAVTVPAPPQGPGRYTIFVSTRPGYSPARQGRLVTATDMHFRWNAAAWAVIMAKCGHPDLTDQNNQA